MSTVYLVTRGDYSDYKVLAAFSTKDLAQSYIDVGGSSVQYYGNDANIEEYEMDQPNDWGYITAVYMDRDGACSVPRTEWMHRPKIYHELYRHFKSDEKQTLYNGVLTWFHERAIKVTNELRTRLIAEGKWE